VSRLGGGKQGIEKTKESIWSKDEFASLSRREPRDEKKPRPAASSEVDKGGILPSEKSRRNVGAPTRLILRTTFPLKEDETRAETPEKENHKAIPSCF